MKVCNHKLDKDLICKRCYKPFRRVGVNLYAQIVRVVRGLNVRQRTAILFQRYLAVE